MADGSCGKRRNQHRRHQVVRSFGRAMDDAALPVRMTAMRSAVKVARKSQSLTDPLKFSRRDIGYSRAKF